MENLNYGSNVPEYLERPDEEDVKIKPQQIGGFVSPSPEPQQAAPVSNAAREQMGQARNLMMQGIQEQSYAQQKQAEADALANQAYQQEAQERENLAQKKREESLLKIQEQEQEVRRIGEEVAAGKIEPQSVFANKSTFQKIMIGLGGLMAAFNPNTARAFASSINQQVQNDIDAQRYNLQGKKDKLGAAQSLYAKMLDKYRDEETAAEQTRRGMLGVLKAKIEANAANAKGQLAKANLLKMAGEIEKEMAESGMEVQEKQMQQDRYKSERTVPGYIGQTRTPGDATKVSEVVADTEAGSQAIDRLIELSKTVWTKVPGTEERAEAAGLRQKLIGSLKTAYVGPGAMSDKEREAIIQALGDPTEFFTKQSNVVKKLQTAKEQIIRSRDALARSMGLKKDVPQGAKEIK